MFVCLRLDCGFDVLRTSNMPRFRLCLPVLYLLDVRGWPVTCLLILNQGLFGVERLLRTSKVQTFCTRPLQEKYVSLLCQPPGLMSYGDVDLVHQLTVRGAVFGLYFLAIEIKIKEQSKT